ncbi:restriction endonuclease [Paenibacillus tritici]|uniref:Restriction endonuclease n=1 Tax=Paenibacillus tritici TaxID=1873425 RepID=A0ABX2DQK7_9BACL|nr:restriction endonuclease [Paenibacillus tritici]NQX46948.1 restriction endonuclease [Paenibacillus tritici]
MLKTFLEWSKKNLSNIFSIVGIALTIYFGAFYVPGYLAEMRAEKVNAINEAIIQDIQELIYNRENITATEIDTLIKAKEIKYNISYPFTTNELLIQISGRFIENKFIPLEQRKELFDKVDALRKTIKEPQPIKKEEANSLVMKVLSTIISILSIIIAALGLNSTFFKAKKDRENQIEQDIEKREEEIQSSIMNAFAFELVVKNALNGYDFEYNIWGSDQGIDFKLNVGGVEYVIVCKYYKRAISIVDVRKILETANLTQLKTILVTNNSLTKSANQHIEEYNSKNIIKLYVIQGETEKDIKKQIAAIVDN